MSVITTPHLIGSAERWGDEAFARICKIVVDSNDSINQSVMENRTDLFDIMSNDDLIAGDDLGLSVAYLAVYYDQPDILTYLHKRGIDLGQPCDPMGYGTTLFYAVMMGRLQIVIYLHKLGYLLQKPCETAFYQTPLHYAKRKGNGEVIDFITKVVTREQRAKDLMHKNVMCRYYYRKYQLQRRRIILLQSLYRRRLAKALVKGIRSGEIVLESDSSEEEEDEEEESDEGEHSKGLSHVEEEPNEDDDTERVSVQPKQNTINEEVGEQYEEDDDSELDDDDRDDD